jgi:hypothetical protein
MPVQAPAGKLSWFGILEFWNDGIRKEPPQKGFDQFSRNLPLFQHSNISI